MNPTRRLEKRDTPQPRLEKRAEAIHPAWTAADPIPPSAWFIAGFALATVVYHLLGRV